MRRFSPLKNLPLGAIGDRSAQLPAIDLNLAFRNLVRADMVELASGQQMAQTMEEIGIKALSPEEILDCMGGAVLDTLSQQQKDELTADTPLWFYILREAEVRLVGG